VPTRPLVTRYEDDLALFPDRWHRIGLVVFGLALLIFPFVAGDHWLGVGNRALIAVVGSVSMMILTGFAGQVSLGHAAFLAVGAYTAAILGSSFGLPFWLAIPAAGVLAAAVGLAVGPFALRLEGLYLAIVTIGLLFLVEHALRNGLDAAYGKDYLNVPMHMGFVTDPDVRAGLGTFRDDWTLGSVVLEGRQKLYFLFLVLAGFATWFGYNLKRSRTGRSMMAVRDRDLAAAALGVHPAHTKFVAFGISSFLAGVAGAMYGFAHPVVTLEPFGLKMSVEYIAMVVLGGVGTIFGAVWGALAYTVLAPLAEALGEALPFPPGFSSEHQSVLIFFPLLCLFLVLEPLGLLGIWLRIKRYFLAWPFRY
jgi:branched-chain amino acid transport system permease protein